MEQHADEPEGVEVEWIAVDQPDCEAAADLDSGFAFVSAEAQMVDEPPPRVKAWQSDEPQDHPVDRPTATAGPSHPAKRLTLRHLAIAIAGYAGLVTAGLMVQMLPSGSFHVTTGTPFLVGHLLAIGFLLGVIAFSGDKRARLALNNPLSRENFLIALTVYAATVPLFIAARLLSGRLVAMVGGTVSQGIPFISGGGGTGGGWNASGIWIILGAVLIVPAAQELLFRVVVPISIGYRYPARNALITSGVLYGLPFGLHGFLPMTVLGLSLGWIRQRSGTVLCPLIIHMLHNLFFILFALR